MSGKIVFKVRKGVSKDPKYEYYPEWYLEVYDEQDPQKIVRLSPPLERIGKLLMEILLHEKSVNTFRQRHPQASKIKKQFQKILDELDIQEEEEKSNRM